MLASDVAEYLEHFGVKDYSVCIGQYAVTDTEDRVLEGDSVALIRFKTDEDRATYVRYKDGSWNKPGPGRRKARNA